MVKKNIIIFCMVLLFGILLINIISAVDVSNCCERLKNNGAWCQNAISSDCATGINPLTNANYKKFPTSCEATSYCKLGTCVNSLQGSCMPNTPQVVCNNEKGLWKDSKIEDLPECQLGCCLLGNQAAFVTQTECKKLSSDQGLTTNYRSDINTELECIASITSDEMGACVFERDYQKTCIMTSQKNCNEIKTSTYSGDLNIENINDESVTFHKGYLCSATDLKTNCGPRGGTICKDEQVYFLDTCGNPANIYDYSKLNNANYWTYIQDPPCDNGLGNKDSKTCGACDYFSGSICQSSSKLGNTKPNYGNSVCASLDCTYNGKAYLHGETWCADNSKSSSPNLIGKNLPGSRNFRLLCYNGEVTVEPCSEFRNEICIQDQVNNFKVADCSVNKWQDCINQSSKEDCLDSYARDCNWISGYSILKDANTGEDVGKDENNISGSCVPKYTPGFDFWSGEGQGPEICNLGSSTCIVEYEIGFFASKKKLAKADWATKKKHCVKNCECIPDGSPEYIKWFSTHDNICISLGDCGNKKNYIGYFGNNKSVFTSEFIKNP
jgi:hypothetical protein